MSPHDTSPTEPPTTGSDATDDASGRRTFLRRAGRRLIYVVPLIETFRASRLLAQSAAGSAQISSTGN
ncbi:MAG: hypothetical protein U1A27_01925 [Phycisphaerae bacterium]